MSKTIRTPDLTFKTHTIRRRFAEALCSDNQLAYDVARPLFEAGVDVAAFSQRRNFQSGGGPRPYHDLSLLLQGEMHVVLDRKEYDLKPGDLQVCPAGTALEWSTGKTGAWQLWFQLRDIPAWAPLKKQGGYVRPYESTALAYLLLRDILDAMESRHPLAIARAQDSARAIVNLLRHETAQIDLQRSKQAAALPHLLDAITAAPAKPWTRRTMAAQLRLSISQTTRLFQGQLGLSPRELVIRQRMQHATQLLTNTSWKIATIAAEVGYDSLHSFTRLFTARVGLPPGQYRARFTPHATPPGQAAGRGLIFDDGRDRAVQRVRESAQADDIRPATR